MYNDLTEELVNARKEAVFLTNQYNRSYGEAPEKREEILRKLLGSLGKNPFFEPDFPCPIFLFCAEFLYSDFYENLKNFF
ncbi:hypothetical protein LKD70_07570 [Ruminococcus sp. CLA-AA-H200]|uniref:Maltose/galactoside acetyltransferase domain-containing protein n=1 Tax=Ruminococcus turbiniformis TaxID=2881258 RepID=A0ABS8FXF3_9FIRM|nr:maltose acetyltransferase domain-containing protein [Ruminococcus turbiniformis]MCC2254284.1 hypothetical protein [Ruminococcus turbiniformis]